MILGRWSLYRLGIEVVLLFAFFFPSACSKSMSPDEAQRVLELFYSDNVPESLCDRYLLDTGKAIVPYLMVEIEKKDMPKRRYAILALGKIGDKRALPVLIRILSDRSEIGYYRADALCSIWHIEKKLGMEYEEKFSGEDEAIGRAARLLKEGRI